MCVRSSVWSNGRRIHRVAPHPNNYTRRLDYDKLLFMASTKKAFIIRWFHLLLLPVFAIRRSFVASFVAVSLYASPLHCRFVVPMVMCCLCARWLARAQLTETYVAACIFGSACFDVVVNAVLPRNSFIFSLSALAASRSTWMAWDGCGVAMRHTWKPKTINLNFFLRFHIFRYHLASAWLPSKWERLKWVLKSRTQSQSLQTARKKNGERKMTAGKVQEKGMNKKSAVTARRKEGRTPNRKSCAKWRKALHFSNFFDG